MTRIERGADLQTLYCDDCGCSFTYSLWATEDELICLCCEGLIPRHEVACCGGDDADDG